MYYRQVNRGVSFTKAGRYTLGLVLVLGFVAMGSGYNGLYLALSLALSILVVSGLQSEKVMKHFELTSISEAIVEPNVPFRLQFQIQNSSSSFGIYGVENLVVTQVPRFKLMSTEFPVLSRSTVFSLGPGEASGSWGQCEGLQRGFYQNFKIVQRTSYPFGLISKFKVSETTSNVCVLPQFDENLAATLRRELAMKILGERSEQQFYTHRPYLWGDSLRNIDWKKSAGLHSKDWALKRMESVGEDCGILIASSWESLKAAGSEKEYEGQLSRLRTICDVLAEFRRPFALHFGERVVLVGRDKSVRYLSQLPTFKERSTYKEKSSGALRPGTYWVIEVDSMKHVWSDQLKEVG